MATRAWPRTAGALLLAGGLLLAGCGSSPARSASVANGATPSGNAAGATVPGAPAGSPGGRPGAGRGFGGFFNLGAAAQYLGLTTAQLQQQLQQGRSLAQVAQAEGKSVQGLEQALLEAAKSRLDQAVKSGQMTAQQEQQRLQAMRQRIAAFVERSGPPGPPRGFPGGGAPGGGSGGPGGGSGTSPGGGGSSGSS